MNPGKFRLIKNGKIVGYERFVYCNQREGYLKGKSLVPQHSKDGISWDYIYLWELKTSTKGYWFEAKLDKGVYIEHDEKCWHTGLKDKNGKEIYEGDIVEMNPVDDEWTTVVVWWEEQASFELKSFVCYPNRVTNCQLAKDAAAHKNNDNPCIIIGNVHDNPKLLEV